MPTANVVQSKALYELGHVDVPRLIWKNFMPAFVGVVVSALYNIVDRIFIGQEVGPFACRVERGFPHYAVAAGFRHAHWVGLIGAGIPVAGGA